MNSHEVPLKSLFVDCEKNMSSARLQLVRLKRRTRLKALILPVARLAAGTSF
jgi:hypothetical protein